LVRLGDALFEHASLPESNCRIRDGANSLEQRRIAETLDKADALRAKRRAALAQLDTLTQSIFLDLFGDPATNPKEWPESILLGDAADIVSGVTRLPWRLRRRSSVTG
jgi:hypothetical protein